MHSTLLLEALKFPISDSRRWPNSVIYFPGDRHSDHKITVAIERLISKASQYKLRKLSIDKEIVGVDIPQNLIDDVSDSIKMPTIGSNALEKLIPLVTSGYTTEDENKAIADAIYSDDYDYKKLPNMVFYPHVFALLPLKEPEKIKQLIYSELFLQSNPLTSENLNAIVAATHEQLDYNFFPKEKEAIDYFEKMVSWRPEKRSQWDLFNGGSTLGPLIGHALSHSIVPSLPKTYLTKDNFDRLLAFDAEADANISIALVYFANAQKELINETAIFIRKITSK